MIFKAQFAPRQPATFDLPHFRVEPSCDQPGACCIWRSST